MPYLLILLCFFSICFGELSVSLGQTSGVYLQNMDNNGEKHIRLAPLAGRTAIFFETDSGDHPLWLPNDLVVFGLGALAETRHHDYLVNYNFATYIPFYCHYYLKFGENWSVGAGINFNILQLRYRNSTTSLAQQLGKSFLIRYTLTPDYFVEGGILQTCAEANFNDVETFYDATNYVFKLGYYFERNKY